MDISNARYVTSFKRTCAGHNAGTYKMIRMRVIQRVVGLGRLELPTSPLSGVRSNHLSYRPKCLDSTVVEPVGIEPTTPCLQSRCSPS